eukprot:90653-Chlamydomonas_euryale.AAC.1
MQDGPRAEREIRFYHALFLTGARTAAVRKPPPTVPFALLHTHVRRCVPAVMVDKRVHEGRNL